MVGAWDVKVAVESQPAAAFDLPITAMAAKLPKSLPPKITSTTWPWGISAIGAVIGALLSAANVSRTLTKKRRRRYEPHALPALG
jgi:hypothetical protein